MSVRILTISTTAGSFTPAVTASGLTLDIAAAPYSWMGDSGTAPQSSLTFDSGDVGKFIYVTLMKAGSSVYYHMTVQDPAVMKPVGTGPSPGQGAPQELYPFISGRILAGDLDLEVRQFTKAEAPIQPHGGPGVPAQ